MLRAEFSSAAPFPHVMVRPFLGEEGLRLVREDLEKLNATEKETDLFRFFQTSDLAPRLEKSTDGKKKKRKLQHGGDAASGETSAPALASLADLFASEGYREFCQDITQCGELTARVDLSAQIYSRGGHLLCHDDVIGTRKISFIYYLTDPSEEWADREGGALELYPADGDAPRGTPATTPSKEILPLSDALVLFVVEPGVSFHAVREVRRERARISIQGWLHAPTLEATSGFEHRGVATLQQILQTRGNGTATSSAAVGDAGAGAGPIDALPSSSYATGELTTEDREFLSQWLAPEYLNDTHMQTVASQFADSSYAVLAQFLRPDVFSALLEMLGAADTADGFSQDSAEAPLPCYGAGACDGWEVIGPPHLRRYLRYEGEASAEDGQAAPGAAHSRLGRQLAQLSGQLFGSLAFRRWLRACTRLEPRSAGKAEVRRFRPGLDYTVAAQADHIAPGFADLDVTLILVPVGTEDQWGSEEIGGFESYLAADDDKNETVEAQEVYRGTEDEGPLVNVPAAPNTLSLVMRDAQTLRFVKYVSRDAPSSRVDISACYPVDAPEGSSGEEAEEEGDCEGGE